MKKWQELLPWAMQNDTNRSRRSKTAKSMNLTQAAALAPMAVIVPFSELIDYISDSSDTGIK